MSIFTSGGDFLRFWLRTERRYKKIRNDEKLRPNSVRLGVQSITESIVFAVLVSLCIWLLSLCAENYQSVSAGAGGRLPVLSIIGMAAAAIAAFILFVRGMIGALICLVYQFKLNRCAVRWIALIVWILAIAGIIIFAAMIF